jgi:hypothetical protein
MLGKPRARRKHGNKQRTPDEKIKNENLYVNNLIAKIRHKKRVLSIFRGRPNKGDGADRSVFLYKWSMPGSQWIQGQKFWGENHQERCDAAIAQIRAACNEIIDAEIAAMDNEGME